MNSESQGPQTNAAFQLGRFSIDEARPMKIIIVGAGYSGIVAGIRYLQKMRNIELVIYEAAKNVGGTWFLNNYPGLACDIPSHAYQLTFAENPNWSSFYSSGPEIQAYLESVVDKYQLRSYIRLRHRMIEGHYLESDGKWAVTIRRPSSTKEDEFEDFQDTCDVLFTGTGSLNRWSWPDIPGLDKFEGQLIHSAAWETREGGPDADSLDSIAAWEDKTVGVIGVGSSAIQIVPTLQPRVKHLTNFVRGKTWVAANFVREHIVRLTGDDEKADNHIYTEDEKAMFRDDPEYYRQYRKEIESDLNHAHAATLRGSDLQESGRVAFSAMMRNRLQKKPWIADHIIPDFGVACRRLTPGSGYLEALCEDNVDFEPARIAQITPTGIQTTDGKSHDLNVIVCATGFDITGHLPFELTGRHGVSLQTKWTPHPKTYMTVAVDGFPNWFQAMGPNSGVGAGSLILLIERQVDYAVKATLKIQREYLKSMEPQTEAVADFDEYIDSYFPTTVFGEKCRSWYKAGKEEGRVVALYPGSCTHAARAMENPRWEDFNYERLPKSRNRFHWLGDGNTMADREPSADRAWYLDPEEVDVPPAPTLPWSLDSRL